MTNPFDPGYYRSDELRTFGFASVGDNVMIAKNCTIIGLENISIGDHVRIDAGTAIIAASGFIDLQSYIHMATNCLIGGRGGVSIGSYCVISHGARIFSASDDFSGAAMTSCGVPTSWTAVNVAPVIIGEFAAVGANAVVLPGFTLHEAAALGCLSLASRDLPTWSISAGQPCRPIKPRSRAQLRFTSPIEELAA